MDRLGKRQVRNNLISCVIYIYLECGDWVRVDGVVYRGKLAIAPPPLNPNAAGRWDIMKGSISGGFLSLLVRTGSCFRHPPLRCVCVRVCVFIECVGADCVCLEGEWNG